MISLFNNKKSVLLFSLALVALPLWLSVSFLTVAHSDKQDAGYIKNYVATDKVFRNASIQIAEERSTSYWLIGLDELINPEQPLVRPHSQSDAAIDEVYSQYRAVSSLPGYGDNLRFHRNEIQSLARELKEDITRLSVERDTLIRRNLHLPLGDRDKNLQTDVLDNYSNLIEKLELLRYATTYTSLKQSRTTQNLFAISNAAWNIRLSNHLLAALFEGYLTSGAMARGQAFVRASSHINKIKENVNTLKRADSFANIDSELNSMASELESYYKNSYKKIVDNISNSMAGNSPVIHNNFEWKKISGEMSEYSEKLLNHVDEIKFLGLEKANQKAKRNFLIDVALVLLFAGFICFAYWIVRRVHYQATHDDLTGLPNRRSFVASCNQVVNSETDKSVALIKADLSKFKAINDSFGQFIGDKLLQQVAANLRTLVNNTSTVSRLGSDEFALLVENTDQEGAKRTAENLAEVLSGHYQIDGHFMNVKTAVGFACSPDDAEISEDLAKAADLALQESKQTGAGTVTRFSAEIADAFHQRQQLETELGFALERGEFELHYQPQFDVNKQRVEGVEALIRWRHPEKGLVSPFHFIPVAEDAGMLPAIGEWVIKEAIRQTVEWQNEDDLHLRISVNVSAHQFVDSDVVGIIQNALSIAELDPKNFEIEITESVAMFDIGSVIEKLNKLHNTGVRIALDDFGTGYSSLSYLRDLPLDTLKIDRSFVTEVDEGCRTQKLLLGSIASMAKQLNLHTVAEGVETNSQLQQVCALGIDTVQGYYYSKPVAAEDLARDVKAIDAAYALDQAA